MRTDLIIVGVVFLVIGALLYYVPLQTGKVDTTTTESGNTDVRTSSASVTIPIQWSYALGIIGIVLMILGVIIPGQSIRNNTTIVRERPEKKRKNY